MRTFLQTHEQVLHSAIEAIPESPSIQTFRDKFELFIHVALLITIQAHQVKLTANGGGTICTTLNTELCRVDAIAGNQHPQELQDAVEVYTCLVIGLPFATDLLSAIHSESLQSAGSKKMAQHFTPPKLADLMLKFLGQDTLKAGNLVGDDTGCGAGGLLLAWMRNIYENRGDDPYPFEHKEVFANDMDPLCAAMTSLQIYANRVWNGQPFKCIEVLCTDAISGKGFKFFKNALSQ